MRPLLSSLLVFLLTSTASAQIVGIEEIDSTGYPVMSALLYAYDGTSLVEPAAADVRIVENDVPRAIIGVECTPARAALPASIVLSFEASNAMNGVVEGFRVVDVARTTAGELVGMLGTPGTDFAVQSGNETVRLGTDFTSNQTTILDAIAATPASGVTDDFALLFDAKAGALPVAMRGVNRRVVVHFSNGDRDALSEADLQRAITLCRSNGVEFHAVVLVYSSRERHGMRESLARLAAATGGSFHDEVVRSDLGHRAALRLRDRIVGAPLCRVTWRSETSCPDLRYATLVEWRGASQLSWYAPPRQASGRPSSQPESILLHDLPVGVRFDTTITITAPFRDLEIRDITSSNPAVTVTPRTFTLAAGQSRMVSISFTPTVERSIWSELVIETDLCSERVPVAALYPPAPSSVSTVRLISPRAGELMGAGSDTDIEWTGTAPGEPVDLWFSSDGGATWALIAAAVTGERYAWRVPDAASSRCRVRVEKAATGGGWIRAFGSEGSDQLTGIEIDATGRVLAVGSFAGTIDIGGVRLTAEGTDGFVACFSPDGRVEWAQALTGPGYSVANDVTVGADGSIYVCGRLSGETDFGAISATAAGSDEAFVARFDRDGTARWVMQSGTTDAVTHATAIAIDSAGRIAVAGEYWHQPTRFGSTVLPRRGNRDLFICRLDSTGAIEWVRDIGARGDDQLGGVTIDDVGRIHATGTYFGPADVLDAELALLGSKAMFVLRFDQAGDLDWAVPIGTFMRSGDMTEGISIASIGYGAVRVLGSFMGRTAIDRYRFTARMWDSFVAAIGDDGTVSGVMLYATDRQDWARTIRRSLSGTTISLATTGTMQLGDSVLSGGGISHGILAGADLSGIPRWGLSLGSLAKASLGDHDHGEDSSTAIGMTFSGTYAVGDTTLWSVAGTQDCLVRVIRATLPAQYDTTGLFTIERPTGPRLQGAAGALATGPCLVAVDGDVTITNVGAAPLEVTSATLTGVDGASFSLVAPFTPLTLAPGASSNIAIRFTPTRVGSHSALLSLASNDERSPTIDIPITGRGETTTFLLDGATIDLGDRAPGATIDSLLGITASGGFPNVVFASSTATVTIAPRVRLPAVGRVTVPVRIVVPDADGAFELTIVLVDSLCGTERLARVVGQVTAATIAIRAGVIEARVGDEVELPIILVAESRVASSGATAVRATLRYDATLLDPIGGTPRGSLVGGERIIPLELPIASAIPGSTIARLRFRAMLGSDSTTALTLDDPGAIGGNATVRADAGLFRLLDLCYAGGARLLAPGGAGILRVVSSAADRSLSIDIRTDERGRTRLELMDLLGRTVTTLLDAEVAPGERALPFDATELAAGCYYAVLTTPTTRSVVRVVVR